MKNKLLVAVLVMCSSSAYSFDMHIASLCYNDANFKEQSALDAGKIISNLYKKKQLNEVTCIGWTNLGTGSIWYDVTSEPKINAIDVKEEKLLGAWPLTPWPYRFKMQGEGISWEVQKGLHGAYGIEKPLVQLESPITDESSYQLDPYKDHLGCFSKTPLRYGDVDNDAQSELVLFLNNDLIVFSPQHGKIMFSTTLSYKDELPESQLSIAFGEDRDDLIFQYYSMQGSLKPFTAPFAASRSYAKVYVGHFKDKSSYDILVWRKLYHSRLNSDSIKGFKHDADLLIHYQRNETGEYLPQDTSPETIQNWLSANNLTWQKGFPSKSECASEEGKLIPEMHDTLLNDPDVL